MHRSPLLFALLLLIPLAACGGGDSDEASTEGTSEDGASESEGDEGGASGDAASSEEYADGVCRSIGSWFDEIEAASEGLGEEASTMADDPAAGKQLVLDFLDGAVGLTDTLTTELEDAGIPDTDTGPETADTLVSGIEDVRELFQQALDDTEALPADDPAALGAGLQDIGTALQESATAVGENFEEVLSSVDDPKLAAAFESAQTCQDLATIG